MLWSRRVSSSRRSDRLVQSYKDYLTGLLIIERSGKNSARDYGKVNDWRAFIEMLRAHQVYLLGESDAMVTSVTNWQAAA